MRITDVRGMYPRYQNIPPSWRTHLWQIVVQVETDLGVTGLGYGGGGRASVEVVNGHFRELLAGRQVDSQADIEAIWDLMYEASIPYGRKGIAIMALSGIDLALWDALGKAQNQPVCRLLSESPRECMKAYATGTDTAWYAELGFTATKTPHRWTGDESAYEDLMKWAEQARTAIGPEALLMVDTYMSWDAAVTTQMARRLAEHRFYWFEDVLTPDLLEEQAALRGVIKPVQLAGGEHEFTHHGFAEIARTGALDIWQPDITWCGGITAFLRIVEMAKGCGVQVVPHRGGEVWGLHAIAGTDCEPLAELVMGNRPVPGRQVDEIWLGAPGPEDGWIIVPDRPGFSVELNERAL